MTALSTCLKSAGNNISEEDASLIKSAAEEYRSEGLSAPDAAIRAIDDVINIALADRAELLKPAGKKHPGKKPVDKYQAGVEKELDELEADTFALDQPEGEITPETEKQTDIFEAAHEAATSPENNLPEPTDGQKEAGNYKMGHVTFNGLDITIENPAGSERTGTDSDGETWSQTMANHYGYIKKTEGADGDHVDVFLGDNPESAGTVFVIDQINPATGRFDEHKIVIGPGTQEEAHAIYQANYEKGWQGAGAISEMDIDAFKEWIKSGDTTKPLLFKEKKAPGRKRPAKQHKKGPHYAAGRKAFEGGGDRVLPGYFTKTGKNSKDWYRGWDDASKATPDIPDGYGNKNTVFKKTDLDDAMAALKGSLGQLNAGLDPKQMSALITVAGYHIEAGARSFVDFSTAMVKALGEGVRPYLAGLYENIRRYPGMETVAGEMSTTEQVDNESAKLKADERDSTIPGQLGTTSDLPLEGVQADDGGGTGGAGPAGTGRAGRGRQDADRDDGAGERAGQTPVGGSLATDAGEISISAAGEQQPHVKADNYVITSDEQIGSGGQKTKYKENIAAIRLLKLLEKNNQPATSEEQGVLVRYVGWGGIPQAFDAKNDKWSKEYKELKSLLTDEEYSAARRSTQDAHYTGPHVIHGMYQAVEKLGFKHGRVLESSMGVGHFFGLMPAGMRAQSKIAGIELDNITGGIAKQLYPEANINAPMGFQHAELPDGYFDLAIGNPPFGSQKIHDGQNKDISGFSIHNYFFAKSIDKLRPGGMLAMVVSNSMMDKWGGKQREWMAERTRFIGAIRLPNNAFKQNALTEVTTDIILLQKKEGDDKIKVGPRWQDIGKIADPNGGEDIPLNEYFVANPEMMLGTMTRQGTMYRADTPALVSDMNAGELSEALEKAIENLPANIYEAKSHKIEDEQAHEIEVDDPHNTKIFGYALDEGGYVVQRIPDVVGEPRFKQLSAAFTDTALNRIKGMMKVRDALRVLMRSEIDEVVTDKSLDSYRANLNRVYDAYVKRHGALHSIGNTRAFNDDPDSPRLRALEWDYDPGITKARAKSEGTEVRKPSWTKADIFNTRVREPYKPVESVETAQDALLVSLSDLGVVSMERMRELTGKTDEQLADDLVGQIYDDPERGWVTKDEYLSGNVKRKLQVARDVSENLPNMSTNILALEAVQPKDVEAIDISVRAGSPWVPASDVKDFVIHLLGDNSAPKVSYQSLIGKWFISVTGNADRVKNRSQWGTERIAAEQMLQKIFTGKTITVRDPVPGGGTKVNPEETTNANQKADDIRAEFEDWIWKDESRRLRLSRVYNDTYNTDRTRGYDGSHLVLPGATPLITLHKHQKDVTWRIIQEGRGLLDHVVGAGKTFAIVASVMERRRMGLIQRPMVVVPNHLVGQWASDFAKLYPGSKVLAPGKKDFDKKNRRTLFAKMATGDWDAIIVAHSHFERIPMPHDVMVKFLKDQVKEITDAMEAVKQEGNDRSTIKELEKTKERIENRLEEAADLEKDDTIDFAELGIDSLYVDEAHEYKNLYYTTTMNRVAGLGDTSGSKKAFDLFVKSRYIQDMNQGSGVTFATGTPISNSMAEMYTMQRYMQYDELKSRGLANFDAWANTFGKTVTDWELDATGVNYKLNTRFAKFVNVPELMTMYRSFADVINLNDLKENMRSAGKTWPVPKIKGGKPSDIIIDRSEAQAVYMEEIITRAENVPTDKKIDNMLKITNDARKMALDMRMIYGHAAGDPDGSKVHEVEKNVTRIYNEWTDDKGVQLVFIDLSTPKLTKTQRKIAAPITTTAEEAVEAEVSMDELLAGQVDFSFYDSLRQRLLDAGIPDHEIAYIHDYNTDQQKEKLFDKVRRGDIRILLGSTPKMGAGMNVQERLVALHHVDAPWRPSDLEQREGRIIRQGNALYERDPEGFEIELLRYATEKTYDARMWQTLEGKAKFIAQLRKGEIGDREIEDIAGQAASYADLKAAATGNPLILEQVKINAEVTRLEQLKRGFNREKYRIEDTVARLSEHKQSHIKRINSVDRDIETRDANTPPPAEEGEDQLFSIEIDGEVVTDKELAGKKMAVKVAEAAKSRPGTEVEVSKYRGFTISTQRLFESVSMVVEAEYNNYHTSWTSSDKISASGTLTRLDNIINGFDKQIELLEKRAISEQQEYNDAITESLKPFKQEDDLADAQQRFKYVMAEFERMKDKEYVPQSVEDVLAGKIGITKPAEGGPVPGEEPKLSRETPVISGYSKSGRKIAAGMAESAVQEAIDSFKSGFRSSLSLTFSVAPDKDTAFGQDAKRYADESIKGAYYRKTGRVVLVADQLENKADAISTLRHEILTHHGLNLFKPSDKKKILEAVSNSRNSPGIKKIWEKVDRDYQNVDELGRAEEVIAKIAESKQGVLTKAWATIVRAIRSAMRAIGLIKNTTTSTEIKGLINSIERKLDRGDPLQTFPKDEQSQFQQEADAPVFFSQMRNVLANKLNATGNTKSFKDQIHSFAKKGMFKNEELEWSGIDEWLDSMIGKRITKLEVLGFMDANKIQITDKLLTAGEVEQKSSLMAELEDIKNYLRSEQIEVEFDREGVISGVIWAVQGEDSPQTEDDLPYGHSITYLKRPASDDEMFDEAAEPLTFYSITGPDGMTLTRDHDTEQDALDDFASKPVLAYYMNIGDVRDNMDSPGYKELVRKSFQSDVVLEVERLTEIADEMQDTLEDSDTIYAEWQLPGGKDYNELLLTLPPPEWMFDGRRDAPSAEAAAKVYRSSHFNEPNIVAHARFNTRTGKNGEKILFLEEVQSDWHQAGRKKGYKAAIPDIGEKFIAREQELERLPDNPGQPANNIFVRDSRDSRFYISYGEISSGVPNAPFKTTWPMLVMKRMIRYAAANGYDQIAWTTGEQQADRYSLIKRVDEINYSEADGLYDIDVSTKSHGAIEKTGLDAKGLEEFVGVEMANKIINGEGREYTDPDGIKFMVLDGLDLNVGGEGMIGFYDKMLPKMVNKHIKKWGAKSGMTTLPSWPDAPETGLFDAHYIEITDEMKASAMDEGQPMFSRTRGEQPRDDVTQANERASNQLNAGQPIDKVFRAVFKLAKVDVATKKIYERGVHYLTEARFPESMSWMNGVVETARHGLIDRYGLPESYVQREFVAEADKRRIELQAMDILKLLDKRGVSDINEAQVLQAVLTGERIPDEAWAELADPIRNAIDQLGQEAMELGLISRESYERNKGSYLHRVYRGYEAQQTALGRWVSQRAGAKRKRIRGDELKGRGMNNDVTMKRLLKHAPPDWWGRKLVKGQADKGLNKAEFYILDRQQAIGQATEPLIEGGKQQKPRIVERVYWPADLPIPSRFGAFENKGKWAVRDVSGNTVTLWRDFTKSERESMGEILDARYTIAKTFMLMAHDLSTGRFLKDISQNDNWATRTEPAHWENPKGAMSTYANAEWIKVPTTSVSGTKVKKWGALAGMYVRSEIWRDLNELDRMQTPSFWKTILTQWKLNKTARNPVVHMNNIMSNLIFMDMADIRWRDLKRGIVSYLNKDEHYQDALENGAFGASYIEHEIQRDILDPILQELMQQDSALRTGPAENWMNAREWTAKMSVLGKILDVVSRKTMEIDRKAVDAYQLEDEIFRMATYMSRREHGATTQEAARIARDQFLNYDIRAPWVNAARRSFLPFISYTYRAVPVIAKSIAERPWKVAKYATLAYVMNMLAYTVSDGDEDEERRSMNERVQGRTWLGTPRMIRMPWSDANGDPVFLDIRRWIPAGDVFDFNQGQVDMPAWLQFGGPLMMAGEYYLNKQAFTGKEIVNFETDTAPERWAKRSGWLWRSWMPSAPWIPGSWYWDKISRAATGGRDVLGRDYDLPMAALSSLGVKLAPQDVDLGFKYKSRAFNSIKSELRWQDRQLQKDKERNLIDAAEYEKQMQRIQKKMKHLSERAAETFGKK